MAKRVSIDPVASGAAFAGRGSYQGRNVVVVRTGTVDGVRSALIGQGGYSVWVPLTDILAPIPLTIEQQAQADYHAAKARAMQDAWNKRTPSAS